MRTVLRPDPAVLKKIRGVARQRVVAPSKPSKAVSTKQIQLPIAGRAQDNRVRKRKAPIVRHTSRETSESSKKKLRELRNIGKNKILIIIGNGPSLLEVDIELLKSNPKIDMMSINKPDKRVWPTTHWLFCDNSQLKRHREMWREFGGNIFNTTAIEERKNSVQIKNIGGEGFSQDLLKGFHVGRSSVYAAMQVGLWLGYEHIYILGVDMRAVKIDGKELMHYYGVNPDVRPEHRAKRFDNEAKYYNYASRNLTADVRSKFTFCSSYLKYEFAQKFNKMDHHKAAQRILRTLGEEQCQQDHGGNES